MAHKSRYFCAGALFAAAAICVGTSAFAASDHKITNPMVVGAPSAVSIHDGVTNFAQIPTTVGHFAKTVATLPTHSVGVTSASVVHEARATAHSAGIAARDVSCQEKWHPMTEGPEGRLVANLCSGETPLPLPIDQSHAVEQNLLPTLQVFDSALHHQALDATIEPRQDPAALASLRAVDHKLTRNAERSETQEWQHPLPDSATPISEPYVFDWAPTTIPSQAPTDHAASQS